ncbi:ABC transporter ATP-binding protein [Chelatococcus reniformis]|uniref:ABC transporter domain-containing protein n=1 Tax=Chelatococcus reniformis TaxID=1494448 RepID=A0A916X945_9HYPH|nr:ATP-binding cassette domain-containing protein [Chelatococcus reniformis]GGC53627.1 hypothetical protein GCM10010994_10800 [Chelatococcus reniformis]
MAAKLLELGAVSKVFDFGGGARLTAVDAVSLDVMPGEIVGIVGESGSGKSTLARIAARLMPQSSGNVIFRGEDVSGLTGVRFSRQPARRRMQMVFQDPLASLNPRFTAFAAIADPVRQLGTADERGNTRALVERAAQRAGLPPALLASYPHQLSGGQRARVDIARAIVLEPELLILDEPTSALDASLQAHVVQTLMQLRQTMGMTYIFVSHDLNLVRLMSDRILVMLKGKVVESGATAAVFGDPQHAYTRKLIAAIPVLGRRRAAAGGLRT